MKKAIIETVVGKDVDLISACLLLWDRGETKMKKLYGNDYINIIQKCYNVSPYFCFQVVTNVYAIWWMLNDISDYEKSIVTNCALLALGKMNQYAVLINTFYAAGGDDRKLSSILNYMLQENYIDNSLIHNLQINADHEAEPLSPEEYNLIDVSCYVALQKDLKDISHKLNSAENKYVIAINHLLTYVGCPVVWDSIMSIT